MKIMFRKLALCFGLMLLTLNVQAAPKEFPWSRMVVIGASASSGYGTSGSLYPGAPAVKLSDFLNLMIRKKHEEVRSKASPRFFLDPSAEGKKQVEWAKKRNATAVVALDYLFWFAYGTMSPEQRHELFAKGLNSLESIDAPLLLGLVPDMRASEGKGALRKGMSPSVEVLTKLNKKLTEWAKGRTNVILVPLAERMASLRRGKKIKVGPNKYKGKDLNRVIQSDGLHPTAEGVGMMSALGLETLAKTHKAVKKSAFQLNIKRISKALAKALKE